MTTARVIVHLDMDAFFAAIEQRDNPEYRGKPVIVGADPKGGRGRGVVSTCSYEAREFGIHSALPISQAYRRCPHGVYLPVRMEAYTEASGQIRRTLEEFTPAIEPISIDEAFLDVTGSLHLFGGKRQLAERMQSRIEEETRLTASLGIAPCKLVAKIASDMEKPRGIVIVEPGEVEACLGPLPVARLWGVGKKTRETLGRLGIATIGDLAKLDARVLVEHFGKHGAQLSKLARGEDDRPVKALEAAKSVGKEHTFAEDTQDARLIATTLMRLCENVAHRLRSTGVRGRTVTTKLRLEGFVTFTRARTVERPLDSAPAIYRIASENLDRIAMKGRRVRLIGVTASNLDEGKPQQKTLFTSAEDEEVTGEKERLLTKAVDRIKIRFGENAIRQATGLPKMKAEDRNEESK